MVKELAPQVGLEPTNPSVNSRMLYHPTLRIFQLARGAKVRYRETRGRLVQGGRRPSSKAEFHRLPSQLRRGIVLKVTTYSGMLDSLRRR